jgi:hypothetical protein
MSKKDALLHHLNSLGQSSLNSNNSSLPRKAVKFTLQPSGESQRSLIDRNEKQHRSAAVQMNRRQSKEDSRISIQFDGLEHGLNSQRRIISTSDLYHLLVRV